MDQRNILNFEVWILNLNNSCIHYFGRMFLHIIAIYNIIYGNFITIPLEKTIFFQILLLIEAYKMFPIHKVTIVLTVRLIMLL